MHLRNGFNFFPAPQLLHAPGNWFSTSSYFVAKCGMHLHNYVGGGWRVDRIVEIRYTVCLFQKIGASFGELFSVCRSLRGVDHCRILESKPEFSGLDPVSSQRENEADGERIDCNLKPFVNQTESMFIRWGPGIPQSPGLSVESLSSSRRLTPLKVDCDRTTICIPHAVPVHLARILKPVPSMWRVLSRGIRW